MASHSCTESPVLPVVGSGTPAPLSSSGVVDTERVAE